MSTHGNPDPNQASSDELHKQVKNAIERWNPIDGPRRWSTDRFEDLAEGLFHYQYTHIDAYRTLCERRGIRPRNVASSRTVPAVPTDAFKVTRLFAADAATETFRTSGTSIDARGEHHFRTLQTYRASLRPTFRRFCMPDRTSMRMLILAPPIEDLPDSSLSFMLSALRDDLGDEHSAFFVTTDAHGDWQFRVPELGDALDRACDEKTAVFLLGTAFAFAEFLEQLDKTWDLPPRSRLMETGGFKGRFQSLSRQALYRCFQSRFGLARNQCLSEYSMTELSSQTYTDHLRSCEPTGRFFGPPWLDIAVTDPRTLSPIETPETPGLIRFFDLANVDSICAIQTSDRGVIHPDGGLEFLGRAPDAQLRGCSLTIEEIQGH